MKRMRKLGGNLLHGPQPYYVLGFSQLPVRLQLTGVPGLSTLTTLTSFDEVVWIVNGVVFRNAFQLNMDQQLLFQVDFYTISIKSHYTFWKKNGSSWQFDCVFKFISCALSLLQFSFGDAIQDFALNVVRNGWYSSFVQYNCTGLRKAR